MLFKRVGVSRPYPDHGLTSKDWANIPPARVRISELVTTKRMLDLTVVLQEDSTFFGDLFAHVIRWRGDLYLEDGLHRALRAALTSGGDALLHARIHTIPDSMEPTPAEHPEQGSTARAGEGGTQNAVPPAPEL